MNQDCNKLGLMDSPQGTVSGYEFGPFRLDKKQRTLTCNQEPLVITPKVLDTLIILVQNSGKLLEKKVFIRALWPDSFVEESNLSQNIFVLRKLFARHQVHEKYIQTVPCRGYKFVAAVTEMSTESAAHMIETRLPKDRQSRTAVNVVLRQN